MQNKQKSDPQNPQNLKTSCLSHTGHRLSTNEDLWRKYEEEFIKNEKSGKKCSFIKQKFFQQYMDEFNPQEMATNANLESPLILRKKSSGRKSNVNKSLKSSFQDLDKLKFIKSQIFEEEGLVEQECLQEQNEILREQDKQEKKSMGLVITISFLYLMMLSIQNTVYKMSFNFMRHTYMGNNLTYGLYKKNTQIN
ncbi:hypothetical protein PPERSA_02233 [Pseudocohnilembus persalinus]|uniref:Transmembrane protein n=1 Tax=Pseudocohnilembus persalinus TaxID=266149 RepID=A0A0V0QKJ8_PSEPJ|nr:hypothetical protein PPERSA_02233 [Pseudocohnilembus persalinus]|eukprot:KRX02743.1 hypothetical protein PPERSA_02233 [Pseudocohnilembus persalinus]